MKIGSKKLSALQFNTLFWGICTLGYIITRVINLKVVPIFTDEAIYSYWAQVALNDPAHRFISLEDGKQPLFIWFSAAYQLVASDPLIAGRLVSATAGFFSMIGIFLLASYLFGKKTAAIATIMYIILPFTLFYDRLALYDSLLATLAIYAVYLTVKMANKPQLDLAILNGAVIGMSTITKSSGFFLLYFLPFSAVFFLQKNFTINKFIKWVSLTALSVFIVTLFYNMLRLSPLFYLIARKNMEFIRPFSEVAKEPFIFLYSSSHAITSWILAYAGPPLVIVFIAGLLLGLLKKEKKIIYLAFLFFAPLAAMLLFNKILYPRFVLFYFPSFILITAWCLKEISDKYLKKTQMFALLLLFCFGLPLYSSFKILTKPTESLIPAADKNQFFNDWPAGYGVEEVKDFLTEKSKTGDVYIGTEGTFGLFPFSLNIYFQNNENVHISSYWPVHPDNLPAEITEMSKNNPTYFVFNENQKEITNSKLKLIHKVKKGEGNSYMRLYEVLP